MSLWQPEPVGLGVTAAQWALAWREPGSHALTWKGWAAGTTFASTELDNHRPGPVRITVADELMRHWVVEAPAGMASLRELRSYAAMRFENLFGESAHGWEIEGDWRASGPMVCRGIPSALAEQLREWAARSRLPIMDTMACGTRLKLRYDNDKRPTVLAKAWVWVSVGASQCTLWWQEKQGQAHRITTLRADTANPWARVAQEVHRVNAAQSDDARRVTEILWASLSACAEPVDGELCFTRHAGVAVTDIPLAHDTAEAALLASKGCQ